MVKNKRAQLTIFIIVSLVLVVALITFLFLRPSFNFLSSPSSNPESFIEKCVTDSFKNNEIIILENNGYLNNDYANFLNYKSEKIPYLCTVSEFYSPCVPQEPAFLLAIQKRVETKMAREVSDCFIQLKDSFISKGYQVKYEKINFSVLLLPNLASINIKTDFFVEKAEESFFIDSFSINENSNLYDLIKLSQTIINYESQFCEFDEMNWMKSENKIKIDREKTSDQTKVYTLTERNSQQSIKFAVKTCILPAGL